MYTAHKEEIVIHLFCLPQAIIEQLKVVQNSGNLTKLGSDDGKYKMLIEQIYWYGRAPIFSSGILI